MTIRLILILLVAVSPSIAQDYNTTVPKEIVILRSTKNYSAALETAKTAARTLKKPLQLQGYRPNPESGLSLPRKDCEADGYDYPCYMARGNGAAENSDYISIEYSDAYEGFTPGYYIVVAGIGAPGSTAVAAITAQAKRSYPDAYRKRTRVWFGCMH